MGSVDDPVFDFYERLAPDYHLLFSDWKASVLRQGQTLDALIRAEVGPGPSSILDCTCGIGTQAIGLAACGHAVHATDLSPGAIERARREAESFGVALACTVADVRRLADHVPGTFGVAISCDNALAHFSTDDDLLLVTRNVAAKLRVDGLFLASIRDYDLMVVDKPRLINPRLLDDRDGKRVVFQVWDWDPDGRGYRFEQFIIRQVGDRWVTTQLSGRNRALLRDELTVVLGRAGFSAIRWRMPEESGYYQPIVTARKR
jgi:SAM-dependent methyltransferase